MNRTYSMYYRVVNFLENPDRNWYKFSKSEATIWLDDGIQDKYIVDYLNESLEEEDVVEKEIKENDLGNGLNIVLKRNDKTLLIPFKDVKYDKTNRDIIVKSFDEFIKPKYEMRCFVYSLGSDNLIFTILFESEWKKLEDKFSKEVVDYFFIPVSEFKEIFNMPTDEVTKISKEREDKRDEILKKIRICMIKQYL